ncbi:MAG: hypothetical protein M1814_006005 [Vezdaea aestivalis]|nr:MAG: hypothetical protein M1814_006005 [Vezdaea aestivalis]
MLVSAPRATFVSGTSLESKLTEGLQKFLELGASLPKLLCDVSKFGIVAFDEKLLRDPSSAQVAQPKHLSPLDFPEFVRQKRNFPRSLEKIPLYPPDGSSATRAATNPLESGGEDSDSSGSGVLFKLDANIHTTKAAAEQHRKKPRHQTARWIKEQNNEFAKFLREHSKPLSQIVLTDGKVVRTPYSHKSIFIPSYTTPYIALNPLTCPGNFQIFQQAPVQAQPRPYRTQISLPHQVYYWNAMSGSSVPSQMEEGGEYEPFPSPPEDPEVLGLSMTEMMDAIEYRHSVAEHVVARGRENRVHPSFLNNAMVFHAQGMLAATDRVYGHLLPNSGGDGTPAVTRASSPTREEGEVMSRSTRNALVGLSGGQTNYAKMVAVPLGWSPSGYDKRYQKKAEEEEEHEAETEQEVGPMSDNGGQDGERDYSAYSNDLPRTQGSENSSRTCEHNNQHSPSPADPHGLPSHRRRGAKPELPVLCEECRQEMVWELRKAGIGGGGNWMP